MLPHDKQPLPLLSVGACGVSVCVVRGSVVYPTSKDSPMVYRMRPDVAPSVWTGLVSSCVVCACMGLRTGLTGLCVEPVHDSSVLDSRKKTIRRG